VIAIYWSRTRLTFLLVGGLFVLLAKTVLTVADTAVALFGELRYAQGPLGRINQMGQKITFLLS